MAWLGFSYSIKDGWKDQPELTWNDPFPESLGFVKRPCAQSLIGNTGAGFKVYGEPGRKEFLIEWDHGFGSGFYILILAEDFPSLLELLPKLKVWNAVTEPIARETCASLR